VSDEHDPTTTLNGEADLAAHQASTEGPPAEGVQMRAPRLAIYADDERPPHVEVLEFPADAQQLEQLALRVGSDIRNLGGGVPEAALREVLANLVHADYRDVTITVAQGGNVVRVSDRGPGIKDKERALRTGFTTAGPQQRALIRGVGAGLALAASALDRLGGELLIEDNLEGGTVVSLSVPTRPSSSEPPESGSRASLSQRQLQLLLLVVELGPVGPTRLAEELGVSPSTAYREIVYLDQAGLVGADKAGRRTVTEMGLAHLEDVL
jgi:anti-sigma regulatory factor (Ser/Thr protein kinase)